MTDTVTSTSDWWRAQRRRYNNGLVVAGILAFIAYVVVGSTMLPADADFEVTIFTTLFQGIGYLCMMGLANVCYLLGPWSERIIRPRDLARYRRICLCMGFWFSVLLPFSIPGLLAVFGGGPSVPYLGEVEVDFASCSTTCYHGWMAQMLF